MARNQKNFKLQLYVDDNGNDWNVRGEDGGAAAAVDGHGAADATKPTWWKMTRRQHVRYIVYQDPTTFRTIKPIFYTGAAFAAVALGDIVAVQVAGLATTVNYTAVKKISEKQASRAVGRELPDV
jgi:hypothetical protein